MLEANIWQAYKDRGVIVFAMTRQSYAVAQQWVLDFNITHPVVHDPPPSNSYWLYSHGYIPQNTLTDQNFTVIYDAIGYNQAAIINAIEQYLSPVSVVMEGSSESAYPGTNFSFDVTLKNWSDTPQTFDAWLDGILPGHNPVPGNPQMGPATLTLDPDQVLSATLQIFIPNYAPAADNYRLKLSIGTYPDDIINCDLIEIDVLAGN
jgi:hypothetical protein